MVGATVGVFACKPSTESTAPRPSSSALASEASGRLPDVINKFIRVVRAEDFSAHIDGEGTFVIDTETTAISVHADMHGDDWMLSMDDGTGPIESGFVDGHGFLLDGQGWALTGQTETEALARVGVSFRNSVVLRDIGADASRAGARKLAILTWFGVYPASLQDGTITGISETKEELVVSVDSDGRPFGGRYTLEFAAKKAGRDIRVTGLIDYTFDRVGQVTIEPPVAVPPGVSPGVTLPPVMSSPAWTTEDAGLGTTLEFPGMPTRSTESRPDSATNTNVDVHLLTFQSAASPKFSASVLRYESQPPNVTEFLAIVRTNDEGILGGPVIGEIELTGPGSGAEFIVNGAKGLFRSRSMLMGDVTITWSVGGSILDVGSTIADRFLDSATLAGPTTP